MGYVNPVPGGRLGRTDQGVDVSAAPGTPVRAIATERLMGILPNWYKGQPYYYFKELGSNVYNYVAEQFRSNLRVGQIVQQGQQIGTVASSGTGLELGFAQSAAAARSGHPTPSYREGQATALGGQYRQRVFSGKGGGYTAPRKLGTFTSTAYGPPWGGIQGQGRTSDGTDLTHSPHVYGVAVDPKVIPLGSSLHIWPNPFGYRGAFKAFDTGGAIDGRRIDFYDWRGRKRQLAWGRRQVTVTTEGATGPPPSGITRPGGGTGGNTGPDVTQVLADWSTAQGDVGSDASSQTTFASFPLPGLGNLPGFPGAPFLPNPLDLFKGLSTSVNSVTDFLKILAWIINPVNILRMVEILIGLVLMGFGFQAMLQAYGEKREGFTTGENPLSRSGLGRVSREVAAAAATTTPARARSAVKKNKKPRVKKPEAAPHRTRRQALRLRYEREKSVSQRRTRERREA